MENSRLWLISFYDSLKPKESKKIYADLMTKSVVEKFWIDVPDDFKVIAKNFEIGSVIEVGQGVFCIEVESLRSYELTFAAYAAVKFII